MIDASKLTLEQIITLGIDALAESLGPAGMRRFMEQFEKGSGDYTRDRDKILGNSTLEEIFAQIQQRRQRQTEGSKSPRTQLQNAIDVRQLTLSQIRELGIEVLTRALGRSGRERFMQKLEMDNGDYYRVNKDKWLSNLTFDYIHDRIAALTATTPANHCNDIANEANKKSRL
ncbi:MAG: hypothetical protein GDA48_19945 [Hormoscilla sp. GM102CHS1]|nr:hypothetical protein [Hormoscilla sp. GM102CHS1]